MVDRKTKHNFVAYVFHHGARYLFPLIITPFLARVLGTAQFADFVIWNSSVWTSSIIIEYGFYLYAVKETALAKEDADLDRVVSTIIAAKLMLTPAALLFYFGIAYSLGLMDRQPVAALIGAVAMIAYGFSFAWYLQGRQQGITAVLVEAVPQALQCVLVLAFIRTPEQMVLAPIFQTSAAVISLSSALFIILRDRQLSRLRIITGARAIVSASPYFIERCCFTAYSAATPLILSSLSSYEQSAFYGVGDKVIAFLSGISIPLNQVMLPIVAQRLRSDSLDWSLSNKLVLLISGVTLVIASATFAASEPAIVWLFGESYRPAVPVARWFCIAGTLMAYQMALSNFILIPSGYVRVIALSAGVALTISLAAQVILVPLYGATGSAIARTCAELIVALILSLTAWRLITGRRPVITPSKEPTPTL